MVDAIFRALGRGVVRYRWIILVLWLIGTGAAVHSLPSLASEVNNNNSAFLPADAPSNQAADLAEPLVGPADQTLVQVVFVASHGTLSSSDLSVAQSVASALRRVSTVDSVQFAGVSPDRQAAQVLVLSSDSPNDIPSTGCRAWSTRYRLRVACRSTSPVRSPRRWRTRPSRKSRESRPSSSPSC